MSRWETKRDGRLLTHFNEMRKKENESVKEFDTRFDNLLKNTPIDISPKDGVVLLLYANALEGQFWFMLRDNSPKILVQAEKSATKIEENILAYKVEPFHAPHDKAKTKPRTMNSVEPIQDLVTLLAKNFDQVTTKILQTQNHLMNKVTNLERVRAQQKIFPPRPQYNNNRQQKRNHGWKPRPPNE
jgi:hypothetical protein